MDHNRSRGELVRRAEEARSLLHGEVMAEAFANARSAFIAEWEEAEDRDRREMCWAKVAGLHEVQRQLRGAISQGEHASRQPDER
jgi:hypothetical protein